MILGHKFLKAYHFGMLCKMDNVMSLTRNGIPFTEMLPTNDINALEFCTESTVITALLQWVYQVYDAQGKGEGIHWQELCV